MEYKEMKALKKYMAHKQTGDEESHTPAILDEEGEHLGAEGEGPHDDMVNLHAEFKEKKSHKGKMNPDHAKLLGMEEDEEDGEYC